MLFLLSLVRTQGLCCVECCVEWRVRRDVELLCLGWLCEMVWCACRDFELLRDSVVSLWEQLATPPEDLVSFLSECDLVAPYHPRVLDLYRALYREMSDSATAPLAPSAPISMTHAGPSAHRPGAGRGKASPGSKGAGTTAFGVTSSVPGSRRGSGASVSSYGGAGGREL